MGENSILDSNLSEIDWFIGSEMKRSNDWNLLFH